MYQFDINTIIESLPYICEGLKITLFISVISSFFAFLIGIFIAFSRSMGSQWLKNSCTVYVEFVRNTPLLIHIYLYYKALPSLGLQLPPLACGIIALSLYSGVFISEVLRSGINAVAHEQYEAARGLGFTKAQTFGLIIFPQAIRIVIPPLGSQFISLIKNSSLVSVITVVDVFYVVYKKAVDDFRFFEFFLVGAVIYMILTGFVAVVANIIEHKFKIHGRTVKV